MQLPVPLPPDPHLPRHLMKKVVEVEVVELPLKVEDLGEEEAQEVEEALAALGGLQGPKVVEEGRSL